MQCGKKVMSQMDTREDKKSKKLQSDNYKYANKYIMSNNLTHKCKIFTHTHTYIK